MTTAVRDETDTILVSTFQAGGTFCGVDTLRVQEVILVGEITPVHDAPHFIQGVINLRGKIVTIIDLSRKLGLPKLTVRNPENRILILEWQSEYVGLLVDSVADVVNVEKTKIAPPPANINGVQAGFFDGVFQTGAQLLAILNIDAVLAYDEK